jgi:CelD/BcsL family acetyltransferase involved in cellulose biosynthesis
MGHEDSDFAGVLSTRPEEEAWLEIFSTLVERRSDWDALHLHSLSNAAAVANAARRFGLMCRSREYSQCPGVTMAPSWEAFLTSHRKLKYESRRWHKRLSETGLVSHRVYSAPVDDEVLHAIEAVERDSWKWAHGNASFREGTQRDFLRSMLQAPGMPAQVWLLDVAGEPAAASIVLLGVDRWLYYFAAFRQSHRNAGSLLLAAIIEAAHLAGVRSVSLLRGDHGYKDAWADHSEAVHELVIAANPRGAAVALAYDLRWQLARSTRLQRWRSRLLGVGDRRPAAENEH